MKTVLRNLVLTGLLFLGAAGGLGAQERLYWDFPESLAAAEGDRFPEMVVQDDGVSVFWQEFQGERGSLEATFSVRTLFSPDGRDWSAEPRTVVEGIPYLWLEEVPLFSVASASDGSTVVALIQGQEGVGLYRRSNRDDDFSRTGFISAGENSADTAVAPRLRVASDGSYLLFLTRRARLEGASRPTTLTIFTSSSADGRTWSPVELFVRPETDLSAADSLGERSVLEQNFLPSLLSAKGRDYVAFQSLRQGPEGQVYQIYIKTRLAGGEWSSAVPVTEGLIPSSAENDPLRWDNQRPHLGLTAEGEVLLSFERRRGRDRPGISAAVIDSTGRPVSEVVEDVAVDRYISSFPRTLVANDSTWLLWFDDSGIRLARRTAANSYIPEPVSPDAQTPGADRGSASFPRILVRNGETDLYWQDRAGGTPRTIFLRPDLNVSRPGLRNASFSSGRPGNSPVLTVNWESAEDSSGVLSHSWIWSRTPDASPSRDEVDQVYMPRSSATFDIRDSSDSLQDAEGTWYFALIAQDQAGNWSDALRLSYEFDITPPPPPVVQAPPTDAYGYLQSNTFNLTWEDAEDEDAEYYRWRLDYLASSPELVDFDTLQALAFGDGRVAVDSNDAAESVNRFASWSNLDNGVWAFSVSAVDLAGNVGLSNTSILLTRRYVPVTYITGVTARKNERDQTILTITGRGFAVGGLLSHGIIDRDAQAPWDYEYSADLGQIRILSDRVAEIVGIEGMEEGTYRIGVRHPLRGEAFWDRSIRLDAGGNVKFGPFGLYSYESLWRPAARLLRISGNELLLLLLVILGSASLLISGLRLVLLFRESTAIQKNVRAILAGQPMTAKAREQASVMLRRKGMGLRRKFMMWFTLMVIITILIIALVLGWVWIRMERDTLAEGLESESRLLVETLTSSAATAIPSADRGTLLLLPDRISALPDALWTTVTGPRSETVNGRLRATNDGYEYLWASNDTDVVNKLRLPERLDAEDFATVLTLTDRDEGTLFREAYIPQSDGTALLDRKTGDGNRSSLAEILRRVNLMPSEPDPGRFVVDDQLSRDIEVLRQEVEQEVQDAGISRMINDLLVLQEELQLASAEAAVTLNFNSPEFVQASQAVDAQEREIEALLLEVSNQRFASYPEFNSASMRDRKNDYFVFYKPILYRSGTQDVNFFRGTVRLAVSVEGVRAQLALVQRRIVLITVVASVLVLALGVLAALGISSLVVRPITKLVQGVEVIREQPDMLQHEGFDVGIETGDELSILASSINGMVHGLVEAAIDQKELVAGQEIQKTFLPLEEGKSGKKLSTGGDSNAFFRLFGYYEGADAVSGDYFDFRKLDEDHYVMIKLDIAGHGVTASLIMVQVAALYVDYFRRVRNRATETGHLSYNLRDFTFGINDLINEIGFQGRFAAFNLSVINVRTAEYEMINAGDNLVRIFDGETRKIKVVELPDGPAAGQIDSDMIRMKDSMYSVVKGRLNRGDILFLYTDGIEEAHHILRNEEFQVIRYQDAPRSVIGKDQEFIEPTYEYIPERLTETGELFETPTLDDKIDAALDEDRLRIREGTSRYKQINAGQDNEEFDSARIHDVIEAALNRTHYVLERRCDLTIGKPLHFDFTSLEGKADDAIMALASVEKVFRIIPDSSGGSVGRVRVDRKISDFLKAHFAEFDEFYSNPVDEDEGYIYYSHLQEDPQDDDLTLWAYQRL